MSSYKPSVTLSMLGPLVQQHGRHCCLSQKDVGILSVPLVIEVASLSDLSIEYKLSVIVYLENLCKEQQFNMKYDTIGMRVKLRQSQFVVQNCVKIFILVTKEQRGS